MITATELRIGNLLTSKTWKGSHKIQGIELSKNGFTLKVNEHIHKLEDGKYFELEPILLNEEWLLKFGAINNGRNGWLLGQIELSWITTDEYFEYEYQTPNIEWRIIQVKYVHQLQNLTFQLEGVELSAG